MKSIYFVYFLKAVWLYIAASLAEYYPEYPYFGLTLAAVLILLSVLQSAAMSRFYRKGRFGLGKFLGVTALSAIPSLLNAVGFGRSLRGFHRRGDLCRVRFKLLCPYKRRLLHIQRAVGARLCALGSFNHRPYCARGEYSLLDRDLPLSFFRAHRSRNRGTSHGGNYCDRRLFARSGADI